jgi:uncharacterized protein YaeQ
MAQTATVYTFSTQLSDIDRGVYESFELKMAQQPSETSEYMLMRFLAYCLEYTEGIELTEGVAAGDVPAVLVRDLTGQINAWIEVGAPDPERLHRGSKLAGRAAVYTHRNLRQLLLDLGAKKIHRGSEIPIYAFDPAWVKSAAELLQRRVDVAVSVTERELYLDIGGTTLTTAIAEHHLP